MSSTLQENLTGIQVVTAFDQHQSEVSKFEEKNRGYFDVAILLARIRAYYSPLSSLLVGISVIIILLYGGASVAAGTLTIGALFAFNLYVGQLTRPLSMLGNMTRIYQDAVAGGQRVFEVIDATPDVSDKKDAIKLQESQGRVTFQDVSFTYADGSPSLENISFDVNPGETIILLGGTGSGKSTIVNLIPRFYDPVSGVVRIDGHDLRDVRIRSLRKLIGIVPQETFLFSTSIKENIAYGRPNATDEEIIEAAKTAEAHDFIQAMPKGYETEVGERGVTLSGGEKQRVAIARALLMDPKILILDDSTSSVDTKTEYQIQKALDALLKNRTTFIITQRLSMLRKGDRILVLDQGRIVEQGSHEELVRQRGVYRRIYNAQSGGCDEEEET
jgi:ATP-binding cassette subfamily B protein